jgi:hypothetical protein
MRRGDFVKPAYCEHEFVIEGPHCILCGYNSQPPLGLERGPRFVVSIGAMAVGLVFAGGMWVLMTTNVPGLRRGTGFWWAAGFAVFFWGLWQFMSLVLRKQD